MGQRPEATQKTLGPYFQSPRTSNTGQTAAGCWGRVDPILSFLGLYFMDPRMQEMCFLLETRDAPLFSKPSSSH